MRVLGCATLACVLASVCVPLVSADTSDVTVTVFVAQCTDGIDNDGDSLIDHPSDPGCSSTGDDDETDVVLQACEDGVDNDGDGLTDYPSDPGCDSASDSSEVNIATGGGGGAGGSWTNIVVPAQPSPARVTFSGLAYPGAQVQAYLNGKAVASSTAASDGLFTLDISALPGSYSFGLSARDPEGSFSAFLNIPMVLARDSRTTVQGVAFSPTLRTASAGTVSGRTAPLARVYVRAGDIEYEGESDGAGLYSLVLGTVSERVVNVRAYARVGESVVPWSLPIQFTPSARADLSEARAADMNADGRVDISDFSVLLYWYRRDLSPALIEIERSQFNADGRIDFTDFSIMAYHWTG